MANSINDNEKKVSASIGSIYDKILKEREEEKRRKLEEKESQRELEEKESSDDDSEDKPLSKQEKRERALNQWRDVIYNLTGDDLDYVTPKKKKNKYKKWIDDDENTITLDSDKPKKKKKTNYRKEFEHELNMLKGIVTDSNRFTDNLNKRFQTMIGPNTKDSMPLNKTQVELASAIIASRSNSLSILREIGNLKKSVADLEMKRNKMDNTGSSTSISESDLSLQGSSIISNIIASEAMNRSMQPSIDNSTSPSPEIQYSNVPIPEVYNDIFDPAGYSFDKELVNPAIKYETVPKKTIVEFNQEENNYKYKTINTDTGDEIGDYPNPSFKVKTMDLENKMAKDEYGNTYDLAVI